MNDRIRIPTKMSLESESTEMNDKLTPRLQPLLAAFLGYKQLDRSSSIIRGYLPPHIEFCIDDNTSCASSVP